MDIGFRSLDTQTVRIDELEVDVTLAADEQLRVEISAKFERQRLTDELAAAGLQLDAWWTDSPERFAVLLATRSPDVGQR